MNHIRIEAIDDHAVPHVQETQHPIERPRRKIRDKSTHETSKKRKKKHKHSFADYCAPDSEPAAVSPDPIAVETGSSPERDYKVNAWLKIPSKSSPARRRSVQSVPESIAGETVIEQLLPQTTLYETSNTGGDSIASKSPGTSQQPTLFIANVNGFTNSDNNDIPIIRAQEGQEEHTSEGPPTKRDPSESPQSYVTDDQAISEELSESDVEMTDVVVQKPVPPLQEIHRSPVKRSVLATPKSQRTTKSTLIFATRDDDEDDIVASPSICASHSTIKPKSIDSARKQLFTSEKPAAPHLVLQETPDDEEIDDFAMNTIVTPSKRTLKLQQTSKSVGIVEKAGLGKASPKKKSSVIPVLDVSQAHVDVLKCHIMGKLTERSKLPLEHRDVQYTDVHTLLRETILRSESNSALLIGQKSTGKTLLVENALQSFRDDKHEFLVVRLDGLIQTDDRMALKAIATQLQPDNEDIANADIMTALLAILSHPREFGENDDPLSTVILLDHFEQFTEHPRQTLLYNLFDIAQSKKAPICVLGFTNRVNAYDALEKRVKSRFSHRVIQFPHLSLDQFTSLATSALLCDVVSDDVGFQEYRTAWNGYITDSQEYNDFINFVYLTTINIRDVFAALIPLIAMLGTSSLYFAFPPLGGLLPTQGPTAQLIPDSKLSLLSSLSLLELGLLMSAARLEIKGARIHMMTTIDEHTSLVQKSTVAQRMTGVTTLRTSSRSICNIAWQKLLRVGLLVPQVGRGGTIGSEFRLVRVEVRLESIAGLVKAGKVRIAPWMNSWLTLG